MQINWARERAGRGVLNRLNVLPSLVAWAGSAAGWEACADCRYGASLADCQALRNSVYRILHSLSRVQYGVLCGAVHGCSYSVERACGVRLLRRAVVDGDQYRILLVK